MKDRFRPSCPHLRQTAPTWLPLTRCPGAAFAFAYEIDIRMGIIRGPMAVKILQERRPLKRDLMLLKILKWK